MKIDGLIVKLKDRALAETQALQDTSGLDKYSSLKR